MSRAYTSQDPEWETSHCAEEDRCQSQRTLTGLIPDSICYKGKRYMWTWAFSRHTQLLSFEDLTLSCFKASHKQSTILLNGTDAEQLCTPESLSWAVTIKNSLESIYGLYLTQISINSKNPWEVRHISSPPSFLGNEQPLSLPVIKVPRVPATECLSPHCLMKHSRHCRKLTLTNLRFSYDTHSLLWWR